MSHKLALRAHVKHLLRGLSQQELVSQSEVISRAALDVVRAKAFRNVACFMNMDHSEMKTEPLLEGLIAQGARVYLPRCSTTKSSGQVRLRDDAGMGSRSHLVFYPMDSMAQIRDLKPEGKFELREPQKQDQEPLPDPDLDVILMPGVAFCKKNGARMGHGAGFYDDYVARHLHYTGKRPVLVGLALKEQLVDDVPLEEHDYTLDCLICADGSVKWYH